MTISKQDSYVVYIATGIEDAFVFDFPFIEENDVAVYLDGIQLQNTEYALTPFDSTVDPTTKYLGGRVTLYTMPTDGQEILVVREVPYTQQTDYPVYGPFPAESHERALDKLTMLVQQAKDVASFAISTGFRAVGDWAQNTFYRQGNIAKYGDNYYLANQDHTSGSTFDTTKWTLLIDSADIFDAMRRAEAAATEAQGYASQAQASAIQAANAEANANAAANQATISEGNASAAALNAANCSAASHAGSQLSQMFMWEAEAERLTAKSYADELEDVPVKIYTSNNDGTFTATDTNPIEYSAFHWKEKAAAIGGGGIQSLGVVAPIQKTGPLNDPVINIDPTKITAWDGKLDSVVGTANEIVIDNTDPKNPVISIDPNLAIGGGGGGLEWQTEQSVDFLAEPGKGYPLKSGVTMQLPAAPQDNDQIGWKDFLNDFDQTSCYINPNGNPIEDLGLDNMELNTRGQGGTLVWVTDRWLITDVTEMTKEEPEPTGVKQVQRFTGSMGTETKDIEINPVDLNKSFVSMAWKGQVNCYTRLTAANNVQIYNSYGATTYAFEVIEFY